MNVALDEQNLKRRSIMPPAWMVLMVFNLCVMAIACAQEKQQVTVDQNKFVVTQLEGPHGIAKDTLRFEAIDVFVDSGQERLAAYQFELTTVDKGVEIVGIEGGAHPAFKAAPYYDTKAMNNNRVILAAFNTGDDLPVGRCRVARIHVQVQGPGQKEYRTKLSVSATSEGREISASLAIEKAKR